MAVNTFKHVIFNGLGLGFTQPIDDIVRNVRPDVRVSTYGDMILFGPNRRVALCTNLIVMRIHIHGLTSLNWPLDQIRMLSGQTARTTRPAFSDFSSHQSRRERS